MANEIEIVVKSTNKAAPGFKQAKEDAKDLATSVKSIGDATDEAERKVGGLGSKLSTAGKAVGLASGAAIGGSLAAGFAASLEFDSANAKLKAQLGGSAEFSGQMGKVAGDLYANAYGDSMGQVSDAVAAVVQSGALMKDATNEQIESVTAKAMSLSAAFGTDVAESMRAVGNLVKTKMVPDAESGLDLIAKAFQQLGPNAQDVIDTFTEYSVQFQKIGIDGPTALGLVQQAVNAGARDTDVAADAIKEFSIRSVDGSKAAAQSFKALGFDAKEMTAKFAAGGPAAREAFNQVTDALAKAQGRADYATIAFGLFGTKSEDLGAALGAMKVDTAAAGLGNLADAADKVDEAMGSDAQSKITSMQRTMQQFLTSFVNAPGIIGGTGTALAAFGGTALETASQFALLAVAMPDGFKKMAFEAAASFGKMILSAGAYVAASIAGAAASAAAWVAANIAMIAATGGIILIIGAVIAIVVLLIKHWDWVKEKASALWEGIKAIWQAIKDFIVGVVTGVIDFVREHWQLILVIVLGPLGLLIGQVIAHWDKIKSIIKSAVDYILSAVRGLAALPVIVIGFIVNMVRGAIDKAGELINWFKGLTIRILSAVGDIASPLLSIGRDIIEGIWRGIQNGWSWLMDQVANLARSLLDAAKRAIGISSPSKDFATEFGEEVGPGAAIGITRNTPTAIRAVRTMAGAMLGAISGHNLSANMPISMGANQSIRNAAIMTNSAITLKIQTSGSAVDDFIAEIIRRYVKVQGGDVQQVFGR